MIVLRTLLLILFWQAIVGGSATGREHFEVGLARIDVTPDYPVRLNGFGGRRKESEGVGQRLYAKVIAIRYRNESPKLIYAVDNLGLRVSMVDRVHKVLAQDIGLERSDLALTFTHTHCAPKVDGSSDTIFSQPIPPEHRKNIAKYTRELEVKLVKVGKQALKTMKPAKLSWGVGRVGFAVNRRTRGGPVDHSLPVLFVESADNDVLGVFTTYACHCVTLSYNKLHGDWAGSAQQAIEKEFPGAIGMVSIGFGSDANPNTGVTGGNEKAADRLGLEIANEVKQVFARRMPLRPASLKSQLEIIDLDLENVPDQADLTRLAKQGGSAGYNAAYQLARIKRGEQIMDRIKYPVQSLQFGDQLAMVFLAGEVCVDYAILLKKELDSDKLWLHGYSNDFCAYIPSERLLREGGYGGGAEIVYFGLPAKLKSGMEKKIMTEVKRQIGGSFKVTEGTQGSAAKTPTESIRKMKVPADTEVKLVASEPVIRDPVAIDFGFEGELWVVEMPDYARKVDGKFKGNGMVKRLVDKNGDGIFETKTDFLGGLRFPTGVKVWKRGILVCDAPNIIYAEDTDNDGVADRIETWLSGFATHNPHARVNSLEMGLDGWLYGSSGLFGGLITNRSGQTVDLRGRDFRWDPDSDRLEPATGISQQGRARDDWDRWYGCDNGTLLKYFSIEDRYTRRNPDVAAPRTQLSPLSGQTGNQLFPAGELVLFKLSGAAGRPTSACGLGIYRDQVLGKEFYGNAFTCEPVNQLIHRRQINYSSGTPIATRVKEEADTEFLTSTDNWFRPVQVKTGPDGGLWFVDMYRYVIEHPRWIPDSTKKNLNLFAGTRLGRIYKVVPAGHVQKRVSIANSTDQQLVRLALGTNGTTRDLAMQWMVWKKRNDLVPNLLAGIQHASPPARAVVLAIAEKLGELDSRTLVKFLDDSSPLVVCLALRSAENFLDRSEVLDKVIAYGDDGHPMVKKQAYWTLTGSDAKKIHEFLIRNWPKVHADPEISYAVLSSINRETSSIWRTKVFGTPGQKLHPAFRNRVLLKQALENVSLDEWCQLFAVVKSSNTGTRGLFLDEKLIALLATIPGRIEEDTTLKILEEVFVAGLESLKDHRFDGSELPEVLSSMEKISGLIDRDLQGLWELIHPSEPTEYLAGIVTHFAANSPQRWGRLRTAISKCSPEIQKVAIDQWISSNRGRSFLLSEVQNDRDFINWLSRDQKDRWINLEPKSDQQKLSKLFQVEPREDIELLIKRLLKGAEKQGVDLSNGLTVFRKNCAACHRMSGIGSSIGPDLGAIANKTRRKLLHSILDPSADIDARYRTVLIELETGIQFSGLVVDESSSSLFLRVNENETRRVLRKDIFRMRASNKSFMPDGFDKEINPDEMLDLLDYLMSQSSKRKIFAGNVPVKVLVKKSSPTILAGKTAAIFGTDIRFEQPFQNIGYWHHRNDHVVWNLLVEDAGLYDVVIDYSCDDSSAGNVALVATISDEVTHRVAGTGGWSNYKSTRIGKLKLRKGDEQLIARPRDAVRGALMDLRSVRLVPSKSD